MKQEEKREEQIQRWATFIIPAVFRAETKIQPQWEERLRNVTDENRAEVAQAYCRAIAEEIVDKTYKS